MANVSIVMPTYNAAQFLDEAIKSCLTQSCQDVELLCVDGGSQDNTIDIIHKYQADDARVSLIHQQANSGKLPGALTLGFAHTTGDYLTWMQSDSLYTPNAIETMKSYLDRNADVDFVYANYWVIGIKSHKIIEAVKVEPPDVIKLDNPIGMCHLWRRKVYEAIGDHNVKAFLAEDYEYWCRVYIHGFRMQPLDEFLYYWRRHPNSLSFNAYGLFESMRQAARYRHRLVNPDRRYYCRTMARLYIDEAFARHSNGDVAGTRRAVICGLLYGPRWLSNRGVAAIFLQSVTGRLKTPTKRLNWPPSYGEG